MERIHSDAMICADCFRAQSEGRSLVHQCGNVKCHFYRSPSITILPEETMVFGNPPRISAATNPLPFPERGSFRSSGSTESVLLEGDLWAYKPMTRQQRSSSARVVTFALDPPVTASASFGTARPQSVSAIGGQPIMTEGLSEPPLSQKFRSRILSVPIPNEASLPDREGHLFDDVDDAFYTLPRPYVLQHDLNKCGTPDKDSGISSPFSSRPPSSDLWLDTPLSGPGTPALEVPGDGVFDMTSFRAEMPPIGHAPRKSNSGPRLHSPSPSSPPENSLLRKFLPSLSIATSSTNNTLLPNDTYSRKVFIGGLPPDVDQEEIKMCFQHYGPLTIDWPHKVHSKSTIPPKGYAFLLFKDEPSVHKLILSCVSEGDKLFTYIKYMTCTSMAKKKVQIRPWRIANSYHTVGTGQSIDCRKAVFVGGVPRPLKACELAEVMAEKFGPVSFVAIDCDADLKYPKGAGCVVFTTHSSFIAAVSSRFMQLSHAGMEKKMELKPYILDDQLCDECHGIQSNGKPAPFFCGSVTCLQYYCEQCWATVHSLPGRQSHRPMLKDIGDREKM